MATVYQMIGEEGPAKRVTDNGEVLARREPVAGGMTVTTAMVLVPQASEAWPFLVLFCAERKTGSYEWLSHADGGNTFKTREEDADFAAAWQHA